MRTDHLYQGHDRGLCRRCQEPRKEHLEPTCPKCLEQIALAHDPTIERYTLAIENVDGSRGSISFNIGKARAMVRYDPRPTRRLDSTALGAWLATKAEDIVYEHLDHIPDFPDWQGSAPGLMIVLAELDPTDPTHQRMIDSPILIDGTHRAAKAVRDHSEFFVYPLTDAEMMACIAETQNAVVGQFIGEAAADLSETGIQAQ